MGYSVYLLLEPEEAEKVIRFVEELENTGFYEGEEMSYVRGPVFSDKHTPREEGLSYVATRHKKQPIVGFDYGEHCTAHALLFHLAGLLGKTQYVYDGQETYNVPSETPLDWLARPGLMLGSALGDDLRKRLTPVMEAMTASWEKTASQRK